MFGSMGTTITIIVVASILIGFIPVFAIMRNAGKNRKLLQTGVPAPATILQIWDTGVTINDNPQVGFLLQVQPPQEAPFQAEARFTVSRLQIPMFQPGAMVQVHYDPADRRKVMVSAVMNRMGY